MAIKLEGGGAGGGGPATSGWTFFFAASLTSLDILEDKNCKREDLNKNNKKINIVKEEIKSSLTIVLYELKSF